MHTQGDTSNTWMPLHLFVCGSVTLSSRERVRSLTEQEVCLVECCCFVSLYTLCVYNDMWVKNSFFFRLIKSFNFGVCFSQRKGDQKKNRYNCLSRAVCVRVCACHKSLIGVVECDMNPRHGDTPIIFQKTGPLLEWSLLTERNSYSRRRHLLEGQQRKKQVAFE